MTPSRAAAEKNDVTTRWCQRTERLDQLALGTVMEEESRARQFASIDEYLSEGDHSRLVLESLINAMGSLPKSAEAVERITKLKDRLRKVGKRERAERESERADR
jgi:hypothetical protein